MGTNKAGIRYFRRRYLAGKRGGRRQGAGRKQQNATKVAPVSISLDAETLAELDHQSCQAGVPRSNLVRQILKRSLARRRAAI